MIWEILLFLAVLGPALVTTILQRSAWPFEAYPMFSTPFIPEKLKVFRIAYEDENGTMQWWRPHNYKFQQILGSEVRASFRLPSPRRERRIEKLFNKIEHCWPDDHGATNARTICIFLRRCYQSENGEWHIAQKAVARRSRSESLKSRS
jgi:hypothetical protein